MHGRDGVRGRTRGGRLVALALGAGLGGLVVALAWPRLSGEAEEDYVELERYLEATRAIVVRGTEDPSPPYVLRAGVHDPPSIVINSLGLRGPELEEPKRRKRILVLGDSFTFGFGLLEGEPFAAVLGERLADEYEVVNGGVNGYGIQDLAAQLERFADRVDPDVVIVTFVMNDLDDQRVFVEEGSYSRYPRIDELAADGRFVSSANLQRMAQLSGVQGPERMALLREHTGTNLLPFGVGPTARDRWREYGAHLARIRDGARARGAAVLMFSFAPDANAAHGLLSKTCEDLGIPLFGLPEDVALGSPELRLDWDPHPNARANELFAEHLHRALVGLGLVSEPGGVEPALPIRPTDELREEWLTRWVLYVLGNAGSEVVLGTDGVNLDQVVGGFEGVEGRLAGPATVLLGGTGAGAVRVVAEAPGLAAGETRTLEVRLGGAEEATVLEVGAAGIDARVEVAASDREPVPGVPGHVLVEVELVDPVVLAAPPAERPGRVATVVRRLALE